MYRQARALKIVIPPFTGRGGVWGVRVVTRTPINIEAGKQLKAVVVIQNKGEVAGTFKLLGTLGKFAPADYASGGPLYKGGNMQFYWAVQQGITPNPGNLAMMYGGARYAEATVGAGQQWTGTFISEPLKQIKRYDGAMESVLDVHWALDVSVPPYELDFQQADLSAVKVLAQAVGEIVSVTYSVA